jgi:hypothetical protein
MKDKKTKTELEVADKYFYKLACGQEVPLDGRNSVLRVPGGWVVKALAGVCFVPFDNEFQR